MTTQRKAIDVTAKAVGDRAFEFVISNGARDRDNDRIRPEGWQLADYNGVVLWAHDTSQPAIARSTVWVDTKAGALKARAEFPPDDVPYPLAHAVRGLLASGVLTSASVGFRPLRAEPNEFGGRDYIEQALMEWSIVNVPALPSAVIGTRGEAAAITKWLREVDRDGDVLEIDDGSDGVLEIDDVWARELERRRMQPAARAGLIDEPTIDIDPRELTHLIGMATRHALRQHIAETVRRELRRMRGALD